MPATRHIRLFLLPVLLMAAGPAFPQSRDYSVSSYTTRDGLVNNNVQAIIRDTTGFLWIGTFDGLSRYDGSEFRNYYSNINDTASLTDINILKLCVDRHNNLWILFPRSVCRYDRRNDSFIRYGPGYSRRPASETVSWMATDTSGTLWIMGNAGLERYDAAADRFISCPVIWKGVSSGMNSVMLEIDNKGGFWFLNPGYRAYCGNYITGRAGNPEKIVITGIFSLPDLNLPGASNFHIHPDVVKGRGGESWIVSNNGFYELDSVKGSFLKKKKITAAELYGCPPLVWGGPREGYCTYLPGMQKVICIDKGTLSLANAAFISEEILWCGKVLGDVPGEGLLKVILKEQAFRNITWEETGGRAAAVFGLLKDRNGIIWAGSRGTSHLVRISPDGSIERCNFLSEEQVGRGNHVRSMLEMDGSILVGFLGKLIYRFDPSLPVPVLARRPVEEVTYTAMFWDVDGFRFLERDRKGRIVTGGTGNSFFIISPSDGRTLYKGLKTPGDYYSLCCDRDSNYWVGSNGKLTMLNKRFAYQKEFQVGAPYNIQCITEGDGDDLWIALLGGGIARFNRNTFETRYYTVSEGLSNNMTYKILRDGKGNLWISTNNGLSRFDPRTEHFNVFDLSDGVRIGEFNADAALQGADGEMIFGGMGGIVRFYPDSVGHDRESGTRPLVITEIRVQGNRVAFEKAVYETDKLVMQKGTRNIMIFFTSMNFLDPSEIRYRYRLYPVDAGWTVTDEMNKNVNYSGLVPGDYRFRLESTDENGSWRFSRNLDITIPHYFYQSGWFRILVLCFFIMIVGLIFYLNVKRIRGEEMRKYNLLKIVSLRSQMNPHFIFNSLNSINFFISTKNQLDANTYITRFSWLIRSFLDFSFNDYVPLSKDIETLEEYLRLEQLRFGDKFEFHVSVSPGVDTDSLEVLPMLIQPLVENAIWHGVRELEGRKGNIWVSFSKERAGCVTCTVKDDGVGWKKGVEVRKKKDVDYRPRGIDNVRERLKLINDIRKEKFELRIEELFPGRAEPGTKITVEIPVNN